MKTKLYFISVYDSLRQKYPALETDYGIGLEDLSENIIQRLMAEEKPTRIFGEQKISNISLIERIKQREELQRQKLEDDNQVRGHGSKTIRLPKTTCYKINPRNSNLSSINYDG